jgi:hypothetical protein
MTTLKFRSENQAAQNLAVGLLLRVLTRTVCQIVADVKVRRRRRWTSTGAKSGPETGSLHHPVAEAAISSFDLLKRGAFS